MHATLQDTVSVGRSVCWSVGLLVCRSHFAFFAFLSILKIEKFISKYLISFKTYLGSLLCHSLSFFVIFCHDDTLSFFVFFDHLESFWLFFSSFNYVSITCLIFNHLLCHFLSFSVIFYHLSHSDNQACSCNLWAFQWFNWYKGVTSTLAHILSPFLCHYLSFSFMSLMVTLKSSFEIFLVLSNMFQSPVSFTIISCVIFCHFSHNNAYAYFCNFWAFQV